MLNPIEKTGLYCSFIAFFLFLFPVAPATPAGAEGGPLSPRVERYLRQYKYLAVGLHQRTGIPVTVILAVAGLESQWGTSEIAVGGNNHFGIKNIDWAGPVYCKNTTEYFSTTGNVLTRACFRKYPLIADSYADFGRFLLTRDRYRSCFRYPDWDYVGWAIGLQQGGYATDPLYAEKLVGLIERYRLYEM